MSAYDDMVAWLAERNPPVAAALEIMEPLATTRPLALLGWLPPADRLDLARAAIAVHADDPMFLWDDPVALAVEIELASAWRLPAECAEQALVDEAVIAWAVAKGDEPLACLIDVHSRARGTTPSHISS